MTPFRKKSLTAAVLAFSLLISGCRQQTDTEKGVDITNPEKGVDITDPINQAAPAPINTDFSQEVKVTLDLPAHSIECETPENIINCLKQLQPLDLKELTLADDCDWRICLKSSDEYSEFYRYSSDRGYVIADNSMNIYADSEELLKAVIDEISSDETDPENIEPKGYYSIDCPEPFTEEEYRKAGVACTEAWLTSLQGEDVDRFFRNKGFTITEADDWGRTKCNYLSCGMVNGRKEFVAEICFTAEDCGDNTFYDKYYQEGRYTAAGTFWSGNYICGRFSWEKGKCSLLDMTTRDGCDRIQQGLNGISDSGYQTFFDFARRPDLHEAINNSFVPKGWTVSANLTQTEDGKPINIDIYASGGEYYEETENTITTIWDKRAYINGKPTYSTGLYFTDGGTGHMPDTLPKGFRLTFDNYDGDANPDFCVRYDDDENGTFYVLESVQTDGRIFNLSGRAFEGGIYIAGCTNPSPRLQKTDDIPYVGWKIENGEYYPTDQNGERTVLPDLNMYSDRFYLPDSLKFYSQDENTVTCFLWNNTASPVTTDNKYSIEYFESGQWKKAAESLTTKAVTINPREHGEITYDISALKSRYNTYYRIVQQCGGLTAYGKFCLKGEKVSNMQYEAEDVILGQTIAKFTVADNGIFGGTSSASAPENVLVKDGMDEYPLTVLHALTFRNQNEVKYYYDTSALPQKAGDYTLIIDGEEVCLLKITEPETFPEISAAFKFTGTNADLTLLSKENLLIKGAGIFKEEETVFSTIIGYATMYNNDDFPLSLKADEPVTVKFANIIYEEIGDEEDLRQLYEFFSEAVKEDDFADLYKEFDIADYNDYETFKKAILDYFYIDENDNLLSIISFSPENEEKAYQRIIKL